MSQIKELNDIKNGEVRGLKWQAVKKYILNEAASGMYMSGEALPTENTLCEHLGVSRNTVRQAFKELEKDGYVYRVQGGGTFWAKLNSGKNAIKTQMFGLIIPGITRSLYPSLMKGFGHEQSIRSYQTLVCESDNDVNKQGNIILQLLNRGIDGLAIVPPTLVSTPSFHIEQMIEAGIPVVACHRIIDGVSIPSLTWDREEVGRMSGKMLMELGHSQIAYFGVSRYSVTEAHVCGLREVLEDAGYDLPESRVIYDPPSDTEDLENQKIARFIDLLGQTQRPTAVMCNDDTEAERIYWIATKMGMKVPEDLSIIGFGDMHRDTIFRKMLTSVVIDEYQLGKKAAAMLHEIRTGRRGIHDPGDGLLGLNIHNGTTISSPSC